VILALAALLSACSSAASDGRNRVLFLLGEDYDPQEFWGPYSVLHAAGYSVDLAGAVKGMVLSPDIEVADGSIATTTSLDEVQVSDYFALVVPGGPGGANVARFPRAGQIAREFNASGKFIASVCHGARLLMPEGIFKQRRTTFVFMVADELADQWKAGDYGVYLDLPVVVDRNLSSSRDPRDVPAWSRALIDRFADAGGVTVTRRDARVMIVLPGAADHHKWVLDQLSGFGLSPVVVNDVPADPTSTGTGDARPDMLVILDGPGIERLNLSSSLASMVGAFTKQKKTILVADAAKRSLPGVALESAFGPRAREHCPRDEADRRGRAPVAGRAREDDLSGHRSASGQTQVELTHDLRNSKVRFRSSAGDVPWSRSARTCRANAWTLATALARSWP
jgi:protease I